MTSDATEAWRALGRRSRVEVPSSLRPSSVAERDWKRYVVSVVAPLAELLRVMRPRIVGLSGPPGAGKSTLASLVASTLDDDVLTLSLDDFYVPRDERKRRGLAWRGPPGSHDLPLAIEALDHIRDRAGPVTIPRFAAEIDDRAEPVTLERAPDLLLLDGWFLGYRGEGYGDIVDRLDLLVFLDIDLEDARARRFGREATLREAGGGFSEADMQRFWDEVLGPGMERWTRAAREEAHVLLSIDGDQRLRSVEVRDDHIAATISARIDRHE